MMHHIIKTDDGTAYLAETLAAHRAFFGTLADGLVAKGRLILCEQMRHNLSELYLPFGLPDFFCQRQVGRRFHRDPEYFTRLLGEVGFTKVTVRYPVSSRLSRLHFLLANRLGSYLTHSGYIIQAVK
jgi:hypothetical protein